MLRFRAPLSIGDAYLQHQNAAYQASLGWQDTGDFLISPHMLGKHQYGGMGGAFGLPGLSEVVWPGVQTRSLRDNESGSSSEDQVCTEYGHEIPTAKSNLMSWLPFSVKYP